MLDPEDEGITIIRNVENHPSNALGPRPQKHTAVRTYLPQRPQRTGLGLSFTAHTNVMWHIKPNFFYIPFIVPPVKLQTISTCNISYIDCGPVEEYSIEYPPFSGSRACTVL